MRKTAVMPMCQRRAWPSSEALGTIRRTIEVMHMRLCGGRGEVMGGEGRGGRGGERGDIAWAGGDDGVGPGSLYGRRTRVVAQYASESESDARLVPHAPRVALERVGEAHEQGHKEASGRGDATGAVVRQNVRLHRIAKSAVAWWVGGVVRGAHGATVGRWGGGIVGR